MSFYKKFQNRDDSGETCLIGTNSETQVKMSALKHHLLALDSLDNDLKSIQSIVDSVREMLKVYVDLGVEPPIEAVNAIAKYRQNSDFMGQSYQLVGILSVLVNRLEAVKRGAAE